MTHFAELATIYDAKLGTGQYYSQPHMIPEKWCDSKTLNLIGAPGGDCRRTMDQEILIATSWAAENWAFIRAISLRGFLNEISPASQFTAISIYGLPAITR